MFGGCKAVKDFLNGMDGAFALTKMEKETMGNVVWLGAEDIHGKANIYTFLAANNSYSKKKQTINLKPGHN